MSTTRPSYDQPLVAQLPRANESINNKEMQVMRWSASHLKQLEEKSQWCTLTFKRLRQELSQAMRTELQKKASYPNL